MPDVACQKCNTPFYAKPNWIGKGWGKYCSRNCVFESQKKGEIVLCSICKKKTYKAPKELTRSKSGKFFCTKTCQTIWRNKIVFIGENHANWKHGKSAYRRIMKSTDTKQICFLCHNEDIRILAVHHKDKNRTNNKIENLVWLCHNCHYLVHHDKVSADKLKMVAVVQK